MAFVGFKSKREAGRSDSSIKLPKPRVLAEGEKDRPAEPGELIRVPVIERVESGRFKARLVDLRRRPVDRTSRL